MPEGLHHLAVNQQSLVECDSSSGGNIVLESLSHLVTPFTGSSGVPTPQPVVGR
jgi:hypothetical protein